eukprot:CAMPEP_0114430546 /NCGR_PEP_ID=MMETSP0103-20121206/10098_1 /TAXON_ID=37642 ORGANISM="Paraphysomonas imperforata, Strain PA2" /NCGR_SAMPLE_ID=MMETSP0103 /ASSEMBLY_ACC=CAM_ASM_000201 /LENGTH=1336 /DNA_ID=CAMNT_0001599999 /DNA_START=113 /DNA_END=4123 /DNA_ORIENTATION=-
MVKLSSSFDELSIMCEYGSSAVNKGSSGQDFLLFVGSPKFTDGSSAVIVGKDSDDEALMLEVEDSAGDIRWTSFILEEALVFTIEYVDSTDPSIFYLCTKHEGVFKYICLSSDRTLLLSATCPDILSFEVIELFEADSNASEDSGENEKSDLNATTNIETNTDVQDGVHYAGNLMKKGDDIIGKWKQRYFVARNEKDNFRIDYYEKEGGSKKGSIDCTDMEVMRSTVKDEKFGIVLRPSSHEDGAGSRDSSRLDSNRRDSGRTDSGRRDSGRSESSRSKGRIYRLKALSAESQDEWLLVFSRACESIYALNNEHVDGDDVPPMEQLDSSDQRPPSPAKLTAERLVETSEARTRSRSNSAGSLTIKIPRETRANSSSLLTCMFEEGALGMTLKRRTSGVIYIATVEDNTQAASQLLTPGDTLWSIGSKMVGNVAVDKAGWGELVSYIKQTPRPIEMVFQRAPSTTFDAKQEEIKQEEAALEKEECSSTRSAYSLVDYPTATPTAAREGVKPRPPSPSTPMSLQSMPSMTNSSGSLQSMDTTATCSTGGVLVQSTQQNEDTEIPSERSGDDKLEENEYTGCDEETDIERSIVEDLSKQLIFKNVDSSPSAPTGKGWRSSILGGRGGGRPKSGKAPTKPSFQLVQDGRRLAFEGQLLLLSKRALWQVKIPKMLYLFNDILIVAVPSASSTGGDNKYVVEQVIELMTCKINCNVSATHEMVDGNIEADKRSHLWELLYPASSGTGSMVFLCPTLDVQQKWVQHMAHCICEHVRDINGSTNLGIGWRHQYVLGTMHAAVLQRKESLVIHLLESFAEGTVEEDALEGADEDGYTPLHYASILRLTGIVRLLQESSADVTAHDRRGLTPLHWAALQLDSESLEMLCTNIMDVDLEDHKGRTPLYLACVEGRAANGRPDPKALLSCVMILLTYGANPDRKDKEGLCVLHYLSAGWQYPVVELLLDGFDNKMAGGKRSNCADVNLFEESDGKTALHYVCSSETLQHSMGEGHMILQSVHAEMGSDINSEGVNAGSMESGSGLRTLLTLLEHGALPNMTTFGGHTPLSTLAMATLPRPPTSTDCTTQRWVGAYDSAIVMLISNGARMSFVNPSTGMASVEPPPHWANPAVRHSVDEGNAVWAKTDQLDGDVAGLRLKCYENRKCINAIETSDLRQLAARMSETGSAISQAGGATPCLLCLTPFTMFRRQHHCRLCDALCCGECSKKRVIIDRDPVRVCDTCFCLSKRRVDTIKTEQFFAGQGIEQESMRAELLKGSKEQDPSSGPGKTAGSISSTMSTMEDARLQLQERGDKLQNLGDKSEKLANASNEFANMAKALKEQQKSSWW